MGIDLSEEELAEALHKLNPDKIIIERDDYYSPDNQSYKFLYEQIQEENSQINNKVTEQLLDVQNAERKIAEQQEYISILENELKSVNEITESLHGLSSEQIYVSDISTYNAENDENPEIKIDSLRKTISDNPAIYKNKRPGWFIPLKVELSKKNVESKNINNTSSLLKNRFLFWKKHKDDAPEVVENEYEKIRQQKILELLDDKCTNEEKYLKYMLLSPGIGDDFYKTLEGASQLNLNANLIIALLEQPCDVFNKDIIEMYVSQVRKGNEYNLKQELAQELVDGKWYITATVNGEKKQFQLVPLSDLKQFGQKLDFIINTLSSYQMPEKLRTDSVQKSKNETEKINADNSMQLDTDMTSSSDDLSDDDISTSVSEAYEESIVMPSAEDFEINDSIVFKDEDLK
jgi:hypothetical protein